MAKLFKPDDVAGMLRCSRSAVYKWVAKGRLKPVRAGTLLRFTPEEVERFLGLRRGSLRGEQ